MLVTNKKLLHIKKFGFVGCLNTLIDFSIFSLLNGVFGINYIISQILSYSGGTLNSYLCNKFWTFNDIRSKKKTAMEVIQFITVNSSSLAISILSLGFLMKNHSMSSFYAKILSMLFAQIVNFIGYRFWVFGKFKKPFQLQKSNIN